MELSYELHPLCTLFPRLSGAEFAALRDDIKANGLRQPIVLHGDMILDGGNRYRACIEAGVEPVFEVFDGGNLVSFVLSANLHRRHMSAGQQAAIVASAQDWAKAQTAGSNQYQARAQGPATLPDQSLATVADRAAQSGASERTQRMADKVAKADPELAKQVAHGEISLPKAVEQVSPKREAAAPSAANDAPEAFGPSAEEIAEAEREHEAEMAAFRLLMEADDKLGAAVAEIKRLTALQRVLEERINGLMNEKNAALQAAKSWQRKAEKAERLQKQAA